ncbi:MAG: hypothetical protein V1743_05510 [Nanoarchaeota archaeon]
MRKKPKEKAAVKNKRAAEKKEKKSASGDVLEEVYADTQFEEGLEKREKAEKKSNFYFFLSVGVITIVLVALILVYVYIGNLNKEKDTYNNFKFVKNGMFWETWVEWDGQLRTVPFYHHPRELVLIAVEPAIEEKLLNFSLNGSVFITLDPNLNTTIVKAGVQIARITGDRYGILNLHTSSAMTNLPKDFQIPANRTGNFTGNITLPFPIITCADANESILVIWLNVGPDDRLFSEGNCIVVQGYNENEVLKVAELLDYKVLKIM